MITHDKTIQNATQALGVVDANIFNVENNTLLCIVDYYSKFPVIMKTDGISADSLIWASKENSVRCSHKFHLRQDQTISQTTEN